MISSQKRIRKQRKKVTGIEEGRNSHDVKFKFHVLLDKQKRA